MSPGFPRGDFPGHALDTSGILDTVNISATVAWRAAQPSARVPLAGGAGVVRFDRRAYRDARQATSP
jgi:hypothetical protein